MSNFLFRTYPKYKWALALNDLLIFHVSFFLALKIRYISFLDSFFVKHYIDDNYFKAVVLIYSVLTIYYYQYSNMYKIHNIFRWTHHSFLIMKSLTFIILGFIVFHFLFFHIELNSRGFFAIWFVSLSTLMIITRLTFVRLVST